MIYRVLYHGECASYSTGFGTVAYNILSRLHKDPEFQVAQLALGFQGDPEIVRKVPFNLYPAVNQDGRIEPGGHGEDMFINLLSAFNPHVCIFMGDPWMSEKFFGKVIRGNREERVIPLDLRADTKFITYYPLDGYPPKHSWINQMALADKAVFCARFAEQAVLERDQSIRTSYIPHGVDIEAFSPDREAGLRYRKDKFGLNKFDLLKCDPEWVNEIYLVGFGLDKARDQMLQQRGGNTGTMQNSSQVTSKTFRGKQIKKEKLL